MTGDGITELGQGEARGERPMVLEGTGLSARDPADRDAATMAGTAPSAAPPQRAPAPETARLYREDWTEFATWCERAGLNALPAAPATVAAFLAPAAEHLSAGTLYRRAAAIGERHRQQGFASPAADPAVAAILRQACPRDLAGRRDARTARAPTAPAIARGTRGRRSSNPVN